jgi:hypothetical protein
MKKTITKFNSRCKTLLVASILVLTGQLQSQTGWQWGRSGTASGTETVSSIATDASGNSYATGTFNNTTYVVGTYTLTNSQATGQDIFILKYDASGNLLWAKSYGGASGNRQDYSPAITLDGTGNFYLSGYTDCASIAFGTTTLTSYGSFGSYNGSFLAKFDSNGNPIWAQGFNGQCFAVAANAGGACVTGWFLAGGMSIGTTTFTGAGFFVGKFDANGNPLWLNKATSSTGGGVPMGTAITMDGSGNCIVGGDYSKTLTIGTATVPNAASLNTDMFIAKYDMNGNFIWVNRIGDGANDHLSGLSADGSGNVFVTGVFSGTVSVGTSSVTGLSGANAVIGKYDASGNGLWARSPSCTFVSSGISSYGITSDNAGNCYVGGSFGTKNITAGTFTVTNTVSGGGTFDMFIIKYDPSGTASGLYTLGGINDEEVYSLSLDGSANIYVGRYFTSTTVTVGSSVLTHTSNSNYDIVVARFNPSTAAGISTLDAKENFFTVYPNPSNGKFNVLFEKEMNGGVMTVIDVTGKEILKQEIKGSKLTEINLETKGLYLLRIENEEKQITKKIIVQ